MHQERIVEELTKAVQGQTKQCLPFMDFHQCIVDGHVALVQDILSVIPSNKDAILNSTIIYTEQDRPHHEQLQFQLPVALAAASGHTDMLQLLLSHGADVTRRDSHGHNLVHSVVVLCEDFPDTACAAYTYVAENLSTHVLHQLLAARCNAKALTPLELAAQLAVPEILQLILTTDQVYRFKLHTQGLLSTYEYRVPLNEDCPFLARVGAASFTELGRLADSALMHREPLRTIIAAFCERNTSVMYLELFVMTLYSIFFQVYLYLFLTSYNPPPAWFSIALLCYLFFYLLHECMNNYIGGVQAHYKEKIKAGKMPYCINFMYIISNMLFWAFTLTVYIVELVGVDNLEVRVALYSVTAGLSLTPILFFLQIFPTFSYLSLLIEKMLWELIKFTVMVSIVMATFAMVFFVYSVTKEVPITSNKATTTSNGTNNETNNVSNMSYVHSYFQSMYNIFLLTYTGYSPPDNQFADYMVPSIGVAAYFGSVLIGSILLLNLLIAIFSHQVEQVYRFRYEIQTICRVQVALFGRNMVVGHRIVLGKLVKSLKEKDTEAMESFIIVEKKTVERLELPDHV